MTFGTWKREEGACLPAALADERLRSSELYRAEGRLRVGVGATAWGEEFAT